MANQNAWVKVMFEVTFDSVPIVIVTPVKNSSTSTHFFVEIRNITPEGFEFRAINYDGSGHALTADSVNWLSFVS